MSEPQTFSMRGPCRCGGDHDIIPKTSKKDLDVPCRMCRKCHEIFLWVRVGCGVVTCKSKPTKRVVNDERSKP